MGGVQTANIEKGAFIFTQNSICLEKNVFQLTRICPSVNSMSKCVSVNTWRHWQLCLSQLTFSSETGLFSSAEVGFHVIPVAFDLHLSRLHIPCVQDGQLSIIWHRVNGKCPVESSYATYCSPWLLLTSVNTLKWKLVPNSFPWKELFHSWLCASHDASYLWLSSFDTIVMQVLSGICSMRDSQFSR